MNGKGSVKHLYDIQLLDLGLHDGVLRYHPCPSVVCRLSIGPSIKYLRDYSLVLPVILHEVAV